EGPGLAPGARGSTRVGASRRRPPRRREPCVPAWPAPARAPPRALARARPRPPAGQGRLAQRARVGVPVGLAHPPEAILLTRLGGEVRDRRLVRLDPELRRPD